jgi:hypothetical protein
MDESMNVNENMKNKRGFRMMKEETQVQEIPFLVENIIPEQSVGLLAGLPQAHKTWVGLHLAYCVGTGNPFIGRFKVNKPSPVLYLSFEGNLPTLKRRVRKIIYEDAPKVSVYSVNGSLLYSGMSSGLNKSQENTQAGVANATLSSITQTANKEGVKLIIIDTLRASFVGNENDSNDIANYLSRINKLQADTGASILLLHHIGKNSGENIDHHDPYKLARGSSAIAGSVDYMFGLQYSKNKSEPGVEDVLVLSEAKNRDAPTILTDLEIHMIEENERVKFSSSFLESSKERKKGEIKEQIIHELLTSSEGLAKTIIIRKDSRVLREQVFNELFSKGIIYEKDGLWHLDQNKPSQNKGD